MSIHTSKHTFKSNKTKRNILLIILFLFLIIFLIFFRNAFAPTHKPTGNDSNQLSNSGSILHGTMLFTSEIGNDLEIEFWMDYPKYRLTWSQLDEEPYLHMISPDGKTSYLNNVGTKSAAISYIAPQMHHWLLKDPIEYIELNEWTDGSLDVKQFVIRDLWSIEGASQDFYLEDMTKYYDGESLKKVEVRTKGSAPESEEDLVKSSYTITSIETLDEVDPQIFELVYGLNQDNN